MAELNFTKLADAPILESVPDGAKVYAEVDGKVYRVAGDNLGGGVKTAILEMELPDPLPPDMVSTDPISYSAECNNMTIEEAKAAILDGRFKAALSVSNAASTYSLVQGVMYNIGEDIIALSFLTTEGDMLFYWSSGSFLSTQYPG